MRTLISLRKNPAPFRTWKSSLVELAQYMHGRPAWNRKWRSLPLFFFRGSGHRRAFRVACRAGTGDGNGESRWSPSRPRPTRELPRYASASGSASLIPYRRRLVSASGPVRFSPSHHLCAGYRHGLVTCDDRLVVLGITAVRCFDRQPIVGKLPVLGDSLPARTVAALHHRGTRSGVPPLRRRIGPVSCGGPCGRHTGCHHDRSRCGDGSDDRR